MPGLDFFEGRQGAYFQQWVAHDGSLPDTRRSALGQRRLRTRIIAAMTDQAFDLISVGGGSGGLACAQRAAEFGAKAAVIEPHRLGGTCVNVGCVPKKVMWNAAGVASSIADARDYGFNVDPGENDWGALKSKRDAYVLRLNGIYQRNLEAKGVEYVHGAARFVDAQTLDVNGRRFRARHIVIATGGKPMVPKLPGAELGITSDGFFELTERPRRAAVVGSGYVACELAAAFRGLGSAVEQIIRKDRLLSNFDAMLGKSLMREVRSEGMIIHAQAAVAAVRLESGNKTLVMRDGRELGGFDCLLWAIGRDANVAGLELEKAGVAVDDYGVIITDAFQNTTVLGVYAIGDVSGRAQLTPVAIAAGRRLSDRLFGRQDGPSSGLQHDPDRGVHASAGGHGGGERGRGSRTIRRRRESVRGRFHSHVSRADDAQNAYRHEAGLRRSGAAHRRMSHHRCRGGRDAAGICGRHSHGRHQEGF